MSDLVERLKIEASEDLDGEVRESAIEVMREAATALTAKDKEIEALRERVKEAEEGGTIILDIGRKWKARAETAERERDEARAMLKAMEQECWTLRCVDIPTGCGDADVGWEVIRHYQAEPHDRMVAHGRTPQEALQNALSPKCPNCNDANEYGDYEGATCDVCGGTGRAARAVIEQGE